jgi:hypothetical protein
VFLVTCSNPACKGQGFTEQSGPGDFDDAVRCTTAAGTPKGSPAGLCCTVHRSHEAHVEHVRKHGDSSCRPVTITVVPGHVRVNAGG